MFLCFSFILLLNYKYKGMQHNDNYHQPDPVEEKFQDFIRLGDDFNKIEIYRQALKAYKQALEIKPDDTTMKEKISLCESRIRSENKVFVILLAVAVVIVAVIWGIRTVWGS